MGSQAVYIKSGDQPRKANFGYPMVVPPVYSATAVGAVSVPLYKESVFSVFQASLGGNPLGTASTATVGVQVTMDDNTGRGWVLGGEDQPGFLGATVSASPTLTAVPGGIFTQALVGSVVINPNVPIGTTIASVAANGLTLTMSANATATSQAQTIIAAQNWCTTLLGTITLTGTPSATTPTFSDGFATTAPWRYCRFNVSALTGAGAFVNAWMGN